MPLQVMRQWTLWAPDCVVPPVSCASKSILSVGKCRHIVTDRLRPRSRDRERTLVVQIIEPRRHPPRCVWSAEPHEESERPRVVGRSLQKRHSMVSELTIYEFRVHSAR